ncbi:protein rolling protein isoform X2 [Carex rostrata]
MNLEWYDTTCFAIVAAAIVASLWLLLQSHHDDEFVAVDKDCLWRSAWRGVHPAVLLVLRVVAAAVLTGALLWDLRKYDASIFLYYTEWTFLLVIIYFLIGTIISAHGCWVYYRQRRRQGVEEGNRFLTFNRDDNVDNHTALVTADNNSGGKLEDKRAGTWGYCMQIIYQTCGGAVMLTDVVFWCILVPYMSSAHFSVNLVMGCMHSLNLLFLLVDTLLNSMPFPWFRMAYFILWSCTYVIFQWILHACGFSWWPYPFLELATPWAPLWYFCMALIHVPCYGAYWLIVKAKNTYFPRFFPHSYVSL